MLRRISVSLKAGETLALCGPSGSGKSTLLNLLAGVIAPDAGEVWLTLPDGSMNLASLSEKQRSAVRRRHMGYVFQFFMKALLWRHFIFKTFQKAFLLMKNVFLQ